MGDLDTNEEKKMYARYHSRSRVKAAVIDNSLLIIMGALSCFLLVATGLLNLS